MQIRISNAMGNKKGVLYLMKKNQTIFLKLCLADALVKLMSSQEFESINVSAICEHAGIGRTTFYRHFNTKNNKEELLIFKVLYEWDQYVASHEDDVNKDRGYALLNYIYNNRELFSLIYCNNLLATLMRIFEQIITSNETYDKNLAYIASYFTYGYFGIIFQWLKYNFDETPDEIQKHIIDALSSVENRTST